MKPFDSVVIGGGPAGMTACLYILRAGANVAWVEKMAPGGQVLMTDWIDNYPGFPEGIKGYELVDRMAQHLEGFSFQKYTEEVAGIQPEEKTHRIQVGEDWIEAKTVVLCPGAEHKELGLPGEDRLAGRGVSYCGLCDGQFFKDQVIACIGGGNTALEDSLYLSGIVQKVYLIHRRDAFRGDKVYQDKVLSQKNIEVMWDTKPQEILGQDQVEGLKIENVKSNTSSELDVDGVFIFVGINPQSGFIPQDVERDSNGFIVTDTEMRTSVPGIFAAGDIRSKRCWQISTAVGDGATAGHSAQLYLQELSDG
ncbi:MAG: thioredoxin-disulfide reductase [Desulfovermiculus sp.]|nr:thioredoxin-disulfide reductase [Desulfovermiculus sp.]